MRLRTMLAGVGVLALAAAGYQYFGREQGIGVPPRMNPTGESNDGGWIVRRKTVDYEAITRSALMKQASFLTLTLAQDVVRNRHLETEIKYTPFPSSTATVRVKYHAEYPIGYVLTPGNFAVSSVDGGLVITLRRPTLIAEPSVRLLSYEILDSGILVDQKEGLLALQQRIQPEAKERAAALLKRPEIVPRSEAALRGFLQPILNQQADGRPPPTITFKYR